MPEYLAPGVYVEETSFRAKTIEGVSTSIAGFIGPTRYGPVGGEPSLLTSYTEFERMYGGIDRLTYATNVEADIAARTFADPVHNYMALAVRAFFQNGGTKLYVTRIYGVPDDVATQAEAARTAADADPADAALQVTAEDLEAWGQARVYLPAGSTDVHLRARFPGEHGDMRVRFIAKIGENVLFDDDGAPALRRAQAGDAVLISRADAADPHGIFTVNDAEDGFIGDPANVNLADLDPDTEEVRILTTGVLTRGNGQFDDEVDHGAFSFNANRAQDIREYFETDPSSRREQLTLPFAVVDSPDDAGSFARIIFPDLAEAVQDEFDADNNPASTAQQRRDAREATTRAQLEVYHMEGGHDGAAPTALEYEGEENITSKTGLLAFTDVEDISIVAAPGYSALYSTDEGEADQIQQHLITHCEEMRYRVAVLDSGPGMDLTEVRGQRSRIDTTRAALYYPWITVVDPLADRSQPGSRELHLPPSGYVAGIYARNDVERGVHKAPANEVVRGAVGLEFLLNKRQQDVLNPDGVNAFRFFEGRGYRLWGARTTTSDPEWKYVNVRRYFLYLERSIEKGTQWVVFENNSHQLWAKVTRTIEDFLFNEWNNGALFGLKPEEAYFVRCDRTTMTQNDIDNGRLICLIGVAPVRPAEFVIFRIGQWTADASR